MGKQFVVKNQSKVAYSNRKSPVSVALTFKCQSGNMKLTLLKFMVLKYSSSYCLWYCCYCRRRESFFYCNDLKLYPITPIDWMSKKECESVWQDCRIMQISRFSLALSLSLMYLQRIEIIDFLLWHSMHRARIREPVSAWVRVCVCNVYKYHCMCIGTAERFFGIVSSNCHFCNI